MTFLNPLVLIGLVAAAIPLIIHLFNFRRPRKIDFSSLTFLKELQKTTMQRVRIKQWLLLLLRTLALACLILAFARPTLTGGLAGTVGGTSNSSIALVVDNSYSMTLRDAKGDYLSQVKELASGILDQAENGDELHIVTSSGSDTPNSNSFSSRAAALNAITDVEPQSGAASLHRAMLRAAEQLESSVHLNKEIYILSDLQKSTLLDSSSSDIPGELRAFLVPVGTRTYSNIAVTSVQVNSRIIEEGQPAKIQATLTNHGSERIEDYVASVFLEGERVAQATATLEPESTTSVEFSLVPVRRGWLSGVVQIEDDAFEFDNTRYFTLHVPERRRLLLVQGEGQRVDYLDLVFSPRLTEGRIRFDVEQVPETALATQSLGGFDAVILAGPRSLSSGEISALTRYVEGGGGLLLFPSEGAQASDYNALLQGIQAGQFSGFSGSPNNNQIVGTFERVDYEHPLFEGIFDRRQSTFDSRQMERVDVYAAMNYAAGVHNEQTLIALSNGFPFLQEVRYGNGVALLFAVSPDPSWSTFPVRGLFIPLLYRSVYYLSALESGAGEGYVIGKGGELRVSGLTAVDNMRIVGPQGDEYTPEQRSLFGAVLLTFDASLRDPGVYDVYSGDQLVRRIALNTDSRESDLNTYSGQEAAELLEEASGSEIHILDTGEGGAERMIQTLQEQRAGVELWNVFLLLALIFLVAEMFVAQRWRPETVSV